MSDRIAGLLLAGFAVWYGNAALNLGGGLSDPLGPAAFPLLLAVPLFLLSLFLIIRPDPEPNWARGRPLLLQGTTVAILIGYAVVLEIFGFVATTLVAVVLLSRILGARWLQGVVTGLAISIGLFVAFDQILGLPLPLLPELGG